MKFIAKSLSTFLVVATAPSYAAERLETTVIETANESSVSHKITTLSAAEIQLSLIHI